MVFTGSGDIDQFSAADDGGGGGTAAYSADAITFTTPAAFANASWDMPAGSTGTGDVELILDIDLTGAECFLCDTIWSITFDDPDPSAFDAEAVFTVGFPGGSPAVRTDFFLDT